jgi:hypothetical protein
MALRSLVTEDGWVQLVSWVWLILAPSLLVAKNGWAQQGKAIGELGAIISQTMDVPWYKVRFVFFLVVKYFDTNLKFFLHTYLQH